MSDQYFNYTDQQAYDLISFCDQLWEAKETNTNTVLNYNGKSCSVHIPAHKGFASTLIPNKNGKNFLLITHNLNKSSYGTLEINRSTQQGLQHRITWLVDTTNGSFTYRSNITTIRNSNNTMISAAIEIYDQYGTFVIWNLDKRFISQKAEF